MLSNDEIREICETYCLSRGQVYNIRSTFASMCEMSENWLALQTGHTSFEDTKEGINIDYFAKNCTFLQGTLESISRRILMAAGLDVSSQRVVVDWKNFLNLYCTFEQGQMDKSHLIRFWQKFFDQFNAGFCKEVEYMKLLEEIIRGKTLDKPNDTTRLFAEMY